MDEIKPVAWRARFKNAPELGDWFSAEPIDGDLNETEPLYDQEAIDTLRAEVEAVSHELDCMNLNLQWHIAELRRVRDEKRKAEAEADALRKDAERYRWLREPKRLEEGSAEDAAEKDALYIGTASHVFWGLSGDLADANIDAAMKATE